MTVDLTTLLRDWPYDPDDDMRLVRGADGRELLQVRTPLGVEQFELEGRPDGLQPRGMESAFAHYEQQWKQAEEAGTAGEFGLDANACTELFSEGTLYYFRYLRLFQLKDWARTVRDTARNLRVFDFIHRHAAREEDQLFLEKWRPYILRVKATAEAMLELERNQFDAALDLLDRGVKGIEGLADIEDETFQFERERSLLALRELAGQVRKNRPRSELERLESQLQRAIERQEFEQAAEIRDRIRALKR